MAQLPFMPLATDAYLGDTTHLTTLEHGAYILLLMCMWRNGGWLPDDDRLLARYARMTVDKWRRVAPTIRAFFEIDGERLTQKRLKAEFEKSAQLREKKTASAQARWLKTNKTEDAAASHPQCNPNPNPNEEKKEEAIASSKERAPTSRGTRIDPNWKPRPQERDWALAHGWTPAEVDDQGERFRDYWLDRTGQGATKVDWDRTFLNRLKELNDRRQKSSRYNGRQSPGDKLSDASDRLMQRVRSQTGGAGFGGAGRPPADEPGNLDLSSASTSGYFCH